MKNVLLILVLLLSFKGQSQIISGLYDGTLVNDSTQKVQNYEVALSQYRGKITGYSYTTFVVNDTFYYSIKRVSATLKNNELTIQDEKMIVNNFPESPAKGVKQTNIIPIPTSMVDTVQGFQGRWRTNRTKIYYSLNGSLDMKRDNDSTQSALIGHLRELNIVSPAYAAVRTESVANTSNKTSEQARPSTQKVVAKEATAKSAVVSSEPIAYNLRKENIIETVSVNADSLTLSFYDNGEVDGDRISVYLNGDNVLDNAKLTGTATKKTIPVNNKNGELRLVLVAESLGSLPPNTGLLIIQDGTNKYNIRFSADLQTNAAIILRRSK